MKTWIIAAALGVALSAAGTSVAVAQAGSTGGTIGKRDKSVSGEEAAKPHRPSRNKPSSKHEPAAPRSLAIKLFRNPTINGVRVDRCLHYASACDEPAATAWCKSHGFASASAWKWEPVSQTALQDGQMCTVGCGGFSTILCE